MSEAMQYIDDVLSGRRRECRWVRLACERHVNDLRDGPGRGLWFDERAARTVIAFFGLLRHSKGEWAGQPVALEPWQQFHLWNLFGWKRADGTRRFRVSYLEVGRKNGKSTMGAGVGLYLQAADGEPGAEIYTAAPLAIDTVVPLVDGWTTLEHIREGDQVFDENGEHCRVTYVSPIMEGKPCYEMVFSDGTTVVADADHRWVTDTTSTGRSLRGRSRADYDHTRQGARTRSIFTTKEIAESVFRFGRTNHRIEVSPPLTLEAKDMHIHPYVLGVWLGDGRQNRGSIVIHPDDHTIVEHIEAAGYSVSYQSDKSLMRFTVLGLRTQLRALGLLEYKHVPPMYLRGDYAQRLALLQGLMDTDGTCTQKGECRFSNRNRRLAGEVAELVNSLGLQSHLRQVTVQGEPHYVISFKAARDMPVFRLERKAARQLEKRDARTMNRYIVAVRPVDSVPVRCISVDSASHLYLITRAYIPTHNTKRDQARIVHQEAVRMVKQSPALTRELRVFKDNIHSEKTFSKFEPLGRDSGTLDGLNVHGAIVDEVHAHPNGDMWDVLQTATGARRQPLLYAVTTAGSDRQSLCWQFHDYTEKVLGGVLVDDSWHGLIYTLERDAEGLLEDWEDEGAWQRANPNLGVSKKVDDLRDKARVAKGMPARLNGFLQKELNVWTQASTRWIDPDAWRRCNVGPVDEESLAGRECWGGLDLSSTLDVTALAWVFPGEGGRWDVLCRMWVPEDNVAERVKRDRAPYDVWIRDGWLRTTPGNVVDYEYIMAQAREDLRRFKVREIAFDPWNATAVSNRLGEEGAVMVEFRQGFVSMNPAMKTLEVAIAQRRVNHGGNPVLAWMADNLVATSDPAGNLKPDKGKSSEKIDGVVALLMALQRATVASGDGGESVYATRGLRML